MSIFKGPSARRRMRRSRQAGPDIFDGVENGHWAATVSRPALLDGADDRRFRQLVYDLLTIATRMTIVRDHLGRRMKLSGPQYSVLMAVLQLQGSKGVGVSALAKLLHVTTAFIATETGKLVQAGLLNKRADPKDGRAVLLSLTRSGRALIEQNGDAIRAINDIFFGSLNAARFEALASIMAALVQSSERALAQISGDPAVKLRAAAE